MKTETSYITIGRRILNANLDLDKIGKPNDLDTSNMTASECGVLSGLARDLSIQLRDLSNRFADEEKIKREAERLCATAL